jgi:hypothetical protein
MLLEHALASALLVAASGSVGLMGLQPISGDFLLRANVSECKAAAASTTSAAARSGKNTVEVVFDVAGSTATTDYASYSLEPSTGTIELLRYRGGSKSVLQTMQTDPASWRDRGTASHGRCMESL